jgi:hypothetical protein
MRKKQPSPKVNVTGDAAAPAHRLRWKTLAGLAAVSIVGGGLALLFSRPSQPAPSVAEVRSQPSSRMLSPRAGRIVPLMIDDASLAKGAADRRDRTSQPASVNVLPTIRRPSGPQSLDPVPPRLEQSYPQPWSLLGIPQLQEPADEYLREKELSETATSSDEQLVVHTVVDGDTLVSLAERYLNDPSRGAEIYHSNTDVLRSPELLPIGARLKIPAR